MDYSQKCCALKRLLFQGGEEEKRMKERKTEAKSRGRLLTLQKCAPLHPPQNKTGHKIPSYLHRPTLPRNNSSIQKGGQLSARDSIAMKTRWEFFIFLTNKVRKNKDWNVHTNASISIAHNSLASDLPTTAATTRLIYPTTIPASNTQGTDEWRLQFAPSLNCYRLSKRASFLSG